MSMATTMMEPSRADKPVLWPFVIVVLFMHFQFASLGGLSLTVAPLFVVWFFVTHFRLALKPVSWLMLVVLYLYPFIPLMTGPNLPNPVVEFAKTYGLYVIHIGLLVLAFSAPIKPGATQPKDLASIAFRLLIATSAVAVSQSLVATIGHTDALYNLFGPFQYHYESHSALLMQQGGLFSRAQGLYLEPSYAAYVALSLGAICLLAGYRRGQTLLIMLVALFFIGSRGGQLTFLVLVGLDWLVRAGRAWVTAASLTLLLFVILGASLLYQFASSFGTLIHLNFTAFNTAGTSEYFRMVMGPIVLGRMLPLYPLGLPFGSMEVIVDRVVGFHLSLPNNMYVLLYYFGIFGFLALLLLVGVAVAAAFRGDREATLFYILFTATLILSGSFLSPETTSLIFMLVYQYRRVIMMRDTRRAALPPQAVAV